MVSWPTMKSPTSAPCVDLAWERALMRPHPLGRLWVVAMPCTLVQSVFGRSLHKGWQMACWQRGCIQAALT